MHLVMRRQNNVQTSPTASLSTTLQEVMHSGGIGDDDDERNKNTIKLTNNNQNVGGDVGDFDDFVVDPPPLSSPTEQTIIPATIKTMGGLRIRNHHHPRAKNEATTNKTENSTAAPVVVNNTSHNNNDNNNNNNTSNNNINSSRNSPRNNKNRTSPRASRFAGGIQNKRVQGDLDNSNNSNKNNNRNGTTGGGLPNVTNTTSRRRPHRFAFLRPSSPNNNNTSNHPTTPPPAAPPPSASSSTPPMAATAAATVTATPAVPHLLRRLWSGAAPLVNDDEAATGEANATSTSPKKQENSSSLLNAAAPGENLSGGGPEASSVSTSSTTTTAASDHAAETTILSQTKIIPTMTPPPPLSKERNDSPLMTQHHKAAAIILQPSYLERLCAYGGAAGVQDDDDVTFFTTRQQDDDTDEPTATRALCSGGAGGYHDSSCPGSRRHYNHHHHHLSDDPTVQESIECVFASQSQLLEQQEEEEGGLPITLFQNDDEEQEQNPDDALENDDDEEYDQEGDVDLVAPSVLQQCLLPNRSASVKITTASALLSKKKKKTTRRRESSRLVHIGTPCDPSTTTESSSSPCKKTAATITEQNPATTAAAATTTTTACSGVDARYGMCACGQQTTPILDRERWPQFPLLLRPTPGSGTRVTAIRTMTKTLWDANQDGPCSNLTWPSALRQQWGTNNINNNNKVDDDVAYNPMEIMCPQCMVLPINNGNEEPGEALLTDFESDFFVGTLLLRMRHVEGTTREKYNDDKGYFKGMNRRYQAVIRGRFKQQIPLTQCMTGFQLQRPCGKLPPKWIMNGSLKVLSFFAPQLQANLDGERPSSLTPLGSTPQVLAVHDETDPNTTPLEGVHLEPTKSHHALLGRASAAPSSFARARLRKKQFDKLFIQKSSTPMTHLSKVYTFEFLQHLFNFNDFEIELGSMLGAIPLEPILNGQPLQVMALVQNDNDDKNINNGDGGGQRLWSFDVWHESLIDQALRNEKASSKGRTQP